MSKKQERKRKKVEPRHGGASDPAKEESKPDTVKKTTGSEE